MIRHALIALALGLAAGPTLAQPPPRPAVTAHTITLKGQPVRYSAIVAETFVDGPDKKPAATIITTAYVRDGVADRAARPVMFVFNGGPGVSSEPLQMLAFGPRRIVDNKMITDNPHSLVDDVDLVFIDPVGTGFTRVLAGKSGEPFWSITGDAASVKQAIAHWLKVNGREASPRYLAGESYGTVRAAQVARISKDLHFDGLLVFSLVTGPSGPDMPYVASFATMAASAAYHGRTAYAGRPAAEVSDAAAAFGRTELLPALAQGASLPSTDRAALAAKMSAYIGLPADFIAARDLRVGKRDFMLNLLKDKGLRTGQLDARATGEMAILGDKPEPFDDPSAIFGPLGVDPLMGRFVTEELKFASSQPYVNFDPVVNAGWDSSDTSEPPQLLSDALRDNPQMRLFWAGGYYDLTTPVENARFALSHVVLPKDRFVPMIFASGHGIFASEDTLGPFAEAVRTFVLPRAAPTSAD